MRKLFTESLVKRGQLSLEEAEGALDDFQKRLQTALERDAADARPPPRCIAKAPPPPVGVLPHVETGVDRDVLDRIYDGAVDARPTRFHVHPKLLKQFEARDKLWADGEVDWALAEAMAYGSLLLEGTDIRIAGQDTRRGTFSHRHAVLVDHTNGDEYAPLAHLGAEQGKFWIYDSLLSEYAALGLRVRLLGRRQGLARGLGGAVRRLLERRLHDRRPVPRGGRGQVEPDRRASCMYLPHGYEGQGPSTARPASSGSSRCAPRTTSRWRTARRRRRSSTCCAARCAARCASRSSSSRRSRCCGPSRCARRSSELLEGRFRETIDDAGVADPAAVRRVSCSATGKVGHDAIAARDEAGAPVAVVRVEQLYPWPYDQLDEIVAALPERHRARVAPGGAREHGRRGTS